MLTRLKVLSRREIKQRAGANKGERDLAIRSLKYGARPWLIMYDALVLTRVIFWLFHCPETSVEKFQIPDYSCSKSYVTSLLIKPILFLLLKHYNLKQRRSNYYFSFEFLDLPWCLFNDSAWAVLLDEASSSMNETGLILLIVFTKLWCFFGVSMIWLPCC